MHALHAKKFSLSLSKPLCVQCLRVALNGLTLPIARSIGSHHDRSNRSWLRSRPPRLSSVPMDSRSKSGASSGFPGTNQAPETRGIFRRSAQNPKTRLDRRVRVFLSTATVDTLRRQNPRKSLSALVRCRLEALGEPRDLALDVLAALRAQLRSINEHTRLAHTAQHTPPDNFLRLLGRLTSLVSQIPAPWPLMPEETARGPFNQPVDVRMSGDHVADIMAFSHVTSSISGVIRLLLLAGPPPGPNAFEAYVLLKRTTPNLQQLRHLIARGSIAPGVQLLSALERFHRFVAGRYARPPDRRGHERGRPERIGAPSRRARSRLETRGG